MTTREELKNIRRVVGWTQTDLARKAGITLLTVQNWEKGRAVRPRTERAIREALKAEYDQAATLML